MRNTPNQISAGNSINFDYGQFLDVEVLEISQPKTVAPQIINKDLRIKK